MPAVSGSSGKLVVERTTEEKERRWYPGQVFGNQELSYEEAMKQFVVDSQAQNENQETPMSPEAVEREQKKAEKKMLSHQKRKLCVERSQVRLSRQEEDSK